MNREECMKKYFNCDDFHCEYYEICKKESNQIYEDSIRYNPNIQKNLSKIEDAISELKEIMDIDFDVFIKTLEKKIETSEKRIEELYERIEVLANRLDLHTKEIKGLKQGFIDLINALGRKELGYIFTNELKKLIGD